MQGDQHDQQEEEQDDEDYCSDLEDKVFNNQLSFWLAENELYSKPVSCTTAPATNRGREGRRHTSNNIYGETSLEYCGRVKLVPSLRHLQSLFPLFLNGPGMHNFVSA